MLMNVRSFLYRRLAALITCTFRFPENRTIALSSKHHLASFQDVYTNPFYWDALSRLKTLTGPVLDLGANYGYFTMLCSDYINYKGYAQPDYYLVEANPFIISSLDSNLKNFGIKNYTILNGAAGPISGNVNLRISKNLLASTIGNSSGGKNAVVPAINIENISNEYFDLIKIDIEGAEFDLFDNYMNVLTNCKQLIIELHGTDEQNDGIRNKLKNAGYISSIYKQDVYSGYTLASFDKVI